MDDDAIMGCGNKVFLPLDLVLYLQSHNLVFIFLFGDLGKNGIWSQEWKSTRHLGLQGDWKRDWDMYVAELRNVHI